MRAPATRIACVLCIGNRTHRATMFVLQCDRRAVGIGDAGVGANIGLAAGSICDRGRLVWRQQECRVRSEHSVQLWAFPARAEGVKIAFSERLRQCLLIGIGGNRRDKAAQALCTRLHALAFELGHKRFDGIKINVASFQLAREIESQLKDRIEQRRFACARMKPAQML